MSKYTSDIIIAACEDYISGNLSHKEICLKYGIHYSEKRHGSMLDKWVIRYRAHGKAAFIKEKGNKHYSSQQKIMVVEDYLAGNGSFTEIAAKYKIPSDSTVRDWVLSYNANRELRDYKGAASLYGVSYSQVYSWVRKYDAVGEEGLTDKRGHHKTDDEVDELERLRRENKRLKRQLEENDMLVQLLKKVKEFEGM